MHANMDAILASLKVGGLGAMICKVIQLEKQDQTVADKSKLKHEYTATQFILQHLIDIPEDQLIGMITGTFLADRLTKPGPEAPTPSSSQQTSSQERNSQQSISSDKGWDLLEILDSRLETHGPNKDRVLFLVRWSEPWDPTWELGESFNGTAMLDAFFDAHPEKKRYGPRDNDGLAISLDELKVEVKAAKATAKKLAVDAVLPDHIIYAHWFVHNDESRYHFQSPPTNVLLNICDLVEYYCSAPDDDDPGFQDHRDYVIRVDHCQELGMKLGKWTLASNRRGLKRYLKKSDKNHDINPKYLAAWQNDLLPLLRSELKGSSQSSENYHLPHPRPWREVGYTKRADKREEEHAGNVQSAPFMALIRAISAVEYGDKYIWYYQPLFRLREPGSGGVMETFCTRMLQAGTVDGGTNHHPAGISEYTNEIVFKQSLELYEEHGKLEIARINAATSKERVRKFKKWEKVQELERLEVENEGLQTRLDSRIEDRRVRARALKEAQESVDKIEEMNDELEALVLGAEEKQAKMRGWN